MRMHRCFSNPQLFFEPKGPANALTHSKHPIATPSALRSIQAAPNHSQTASLDLNYRSAKLDFLAPSLLKAFLCQSRFRFFGNIESFSNFQPKFNQPKNRKKLAGGSGIKTRGKSSKIWECYTKVVPLYLSICRNTLCETPVYTLTHVALLTEPEDRKCAYGATNFLFFCIRRPFYPYDLMKSLVERMPIWNR